MQERNVTEDIILTTKQGLKINITRFTFDMAELLTIFEEWNKCQIRDLVTQITSEYSTIETSNKKWKKLNILDVTSDIQLSTLPSGGPAEHYQPDKDAVHNNQLTNHRDAQIMHSVFSVKFIPFHGLSIDKFAVLGIQ